MRILVTGGTGFLGSGLIDALLENSEYCVVAAVRRRVFAALGEIAIVGEIDALTNWRPFLSNVEVVIHTAARAHVINETARNPLDAFRHTNVHGTLNLACQAATAGVRRFIFISSIGVNGNYSTKPFTELDECNPRTPYAISKMEAEIGLRQIAADSDMEMVIVRPPLIYGANAPGNFRRLMRLVASGVPLPLGALHNQRSLVALDNLVDLIVTCLHHPAAANQTFLVSDGQDLSITELLKRTAEAMGKRANLIPVPVPILLTCARLLGKHDIVQQLCSSLQLNIAKIRDRLDWMPPVTVDQALKEAVEHFHAECQPPRKFPKPG